MRRIERDGTQAAQRQHAPRCLQRIERGRQAGQTYRAGMGDRAGDHDRDLAQTIEADEAAGIEEARGNLLVEVMGELVEAASGGDDRRQLVEHDLAAAVDGDSEVPILLAAQADP